MSNSASAHVVVNGVLATAVAAHLSVFDRGFLFGHAVFETLRTYERRPFALDAHLDRLMASSEAALIPCAISKGELAREIETAVAATPFDEAYIRVMLSAGTAPLELLPRELLAPTRVVLVAPLLAPPRALYANGLRARFVRRERAGDLAGIVGAKLVDYLPSILALAEARGAGADEALLVDASGAVVQGSASNLFLVTRGKLVTPVVAGATLRGITREHMLDLAQGMGLAVEIRRVTTSEVLTADEVFLTSSIREIVPCVIVDDGKIGDGTPGPLTKALHRAFRIRVGCRLSVEPADGF